MYPGPRIFPSWPMISQTSGHSDGNPYTAVPTDDPYEMSYIERNYVTLRADGPDQLRLRVREVLRMGASQQHPQSSRGLGGERPFAAIRTNGRCAPILLKNSSRHSDAYYMLILRSLKLIMWWRKSLKYASYRLFQHNPPTADTQALVCLASARKEWSENRGAGFDGFEDAQPIRCCTPIPLL